MIEWGVSSSALILMLIMIRGFFRKRLSMRVRYAMWLAVALRLLIPVSFFESSLSVLNFVGKWTVSDEQGENSVYIENQYISQEEDFGFLHEMNQVHGVKEDEIYRLQGDDRLQEGELRGSIGTSGSEMQKNTESFDLRLWDDDRISDLKQWNGEEIAGLELRNDLESSGMELQNGEEAVISELQSNLETAGIKLQDGTGNIGGKLARIPEQTAGFWPGNGGRMTGIWWLRIIWIFGMFFFFGLVVMVNFSYWRCVYRSRRRYQGEKESRLPVYVSAAVRMPCMFGLLHPAIYLTQDVMEEKALRYVLCHENTHYRHKDNLWTLVRLFCVCIHWFNPLVWLAAYLSKQDCELACDEETIAWLGNENRIDYGRTLLSFSVQGRELFGGLRFSTTMSGRKKQLEERLQMIACQPKKKDAFLIMALLLISLMVLITFTGSKEVEAYDNHDLNVQEENGKVGFGDGDVESLEADIQGSGAGSLEADIQGSDAVSLENDKNINSTYVSVDLKDGRSYTLQVISEPAAENGVYEINRVNLLRTEDETEEVLQSICPGDVKPLYTEALQKGEYAEYSGGEKFLFRIEGEPLYAKSLRGMEELSAYARGCFLADGSGTQLSYLPDGNIMVIDLNFDGYEDFCLQIGVESVNQPFYCYLWNPEEERFEHSVMIPNVKVDREAQLLESATEDGEGQRSVKYYRFDEAGILHMVRYVEENQSPDAVFPFLDLTYHETSYALPAVDDWDAETVYGGALNERYVHWAKEALMELYEWSGTKIDTACFAVTEFGDFNFGLTPQDLEASRCFYDRTFGAKAGFKDAIESMSLCTERVVWYSSVVQWKVPEQLETMTDSQVVEWYFERSALTMGEIMETMEQRWENDYVIKAESGNYYEFTFNQASREVESVYGPYASYPLH